MADNEKRVSELPISNTIASTDRVMILKSPASNASVRTITVVNYSNTSPTANTEFAGVVRVGNNMTVNATGHISIPVASDTTAGVIKIGAGLNIDGEGVLSSTAAANTGDITFEHNVISTANSSDNIYINHPNNGIQIGGSWLTQLSATSNASNLWGAGNTTSYTWCFQQPDEYAEAASSVSNGDDWAQVYLTSNSEQTFYIEAYNASASPAITTKLTYTAAGILYLPNTVGDIYRDGISVLGTGQIDGGNAFTAPTAEITVDGGGA